MSDTNQEPKTRRERLAAIAAEYTEEIYEQRTREQLSAIQPVSRFAAVTSEGSPESGYASNGNLVVGETTAELAELLRRDCGEGWLAHGRVWDLDAPFDRWGNLEVAYSVRVGEDVGRPVQMVCVEDREDGTYLFEGGRSPRRPRRPLRATPSRPPRRRAPDRRRARAELTKCRMGDPSEPGTAPPCAREGIARPGATPTRPRRSKMSSTYPAAPTAASPAQPMTRRERMLAIVEEYAEEVADPQARAQLCAREPVSRFVAITSAGDRDTDFGDRAHLILAATMEELADRLVGEADEGWLAYWRVWDLDAAWNLDGNLEASVRIEIEKTGCAP